MRGTTQPPMPIFTIGFCRTFSEKSATCPWFRPQVRHDYADLTRAMHHLDSIVANLRSLEFAAFDALLFDNPQLRQAVLERVQHILQLGKFAGAVALGYRSVNRLRCGCDGLDQP
jgi:hypothetical protein